jgi:OmpA-OmpF porin, OOP family
VVPVPFHTHNSGRPTTNTELSQRRADAVRQVLVDAGVNPAMLIANGYGSSDSLANNNVTVEGRSNNAIESRRRNDRRVEFHIIQQ